MRKLTITFEPNSFMKKLLSPIFKDITSLNIKELIKIDYSTGLEVGVAEIIPKEKIEITKKKYCNGFEIIDILEKKEKNYLCVFKFVFSKKDLEALKLFDIEVIYDIPFFITLNNITYSLIGEEKNLKIFLENLDLIGKIKKIIYKKADYRGIGISKTLTEKQKNIFNLAVKLGYYNYPRKINTYKLAKRIGISKTTLIEHLRKGENKIINKIFIK